MDLKHEILQDLKRVASDLGRSPTRDEYSSRGARLGKFSEKQIKKAFGTWSIALRAAGLETHDQKRARTLDDQIRREKITHGFTKDIKESLEKYHQKPERSPTLEDPLPFDSDILVLGDIHYPFYDPNALSAVYAFLDWRNQRENRRLTVVQAGDLYDMFAHGKFPRSQNLYTPAQEIQLGVDMATAMWKKIRELVPGVTCYQMLGNHDIRPLKRILEAYPEGELFFSIEKYFQFEGVTTIMDTRQELVLGDWIFIHGYLSRLGDHRDFCLMNVARGHDHTGGVSFRRYFTRTLAELDAGYLADPRSKALGYTPQKITKWTPGFGFIDSWGPRFIPV